MPRNAGRGRYPAQVIFMTSQENRDRFDAEAQERNLPLSEVVRGYVEAGISATDEAELRRALNLPAPGASDESAVFDQPRTGERVVVNGDAFLPPEVAGETLDAAEALRSRPRVIR